MSKNEQKGRVPKRNSSIEGPLSFFLDATTSSVGESPNRKIAANSVMAIYASYEFKILKFI
jgi:hypothetical protein